MKRLFGERTARVLAGACGAAIVVASLVPGDVRPHTGVMPGQAEHFVAYAGTSFLVGFGYRRRRERALVAIALAGASLAFEALQRFIPGRSPSPFDALASVCGLAFGLGLAASLSGRFFRRRSG